MCGLLAAGDKTELRQLVTPAVFSDMKRQLKQREDGGWARVHWEITQVGCMGSTVQAYSVGGRVCDTSCPPATQARFNCRSLRANHVRCDCRSLPGAGRTCRSRVPPPRVPPPALHVSQEPTARELTVMQGRLIMIDPKARGGVGRWRMLLACESTGRVEADLLVVV